MNRIPVMLALLALSFPALAEDDFFLWKVFAGEITSPGAARREVTVNTEDAVWYHPHFKNRKGETTHTHHVSLQRIPKKRFRTSFAIWELDKNEMKDGDFTLILYRDKKILLQHVFRIRGCNPDESEAD